MTKEILEEPAANAALKEVRCGDCRYFIRDGRCGYLDTPEGRAPNRAFEHAPFWVWSDCYSDKEQVRSDVKSACPTFASKATSGSSAAGAAPTPLSE